MKLFVKEYEGGSGGREGEKRGSIRRIRNKGGGKERWRIGKQED